MQLIVMEVGDGYASVYCNIQTPAQRLGIATKVYSWEDIIYKR